jgi:uncharacterized spore protein YtfJ
MARPHNEDASPSTRSPRRPREDREDASGATRAVTGPIESIIRQIGIDKVFGTPITKGETTVMPVAELRTGFGFGSGHDAAEEGGGGGAGLRMIPRGYIEVRPDGVEYRPIYDLKTFVVGGAFVGWLLYRLLSR